MKRLLVAGLGNELRGDDAAGLLAIRALQAFALPGVDVEEHAGDVAALAEAMSQHAEVVIVDAVVAPVAPGSVLELDPDTTAGRTRSSSHGLGVADALALARALGFAPHVRLIGIVGRDFVLGSEPTTAVALAAAGVARRLAIELREPAPCA